MLARWAPRLGCLSGRSQDRTPTRCADALAPAPPWLAWPLALLALLAFLALLVLLVLLAGAPGNGFEAIVCDRCGAVFVPTAVPFRCAWPPCPPVLPARPACEPRLRAHK